MVLAVLLVVLSAPRVLADGKVFNTRVVTAPTQIPDQRAIIVCHEEAETLVIDTAFVGEGTDFAWVVPLPAKPDVKALSPGAFECLQAAFAPRVEALHTAFVVAPAVWLLILALSMHLKAWRRVVVLILLFTLGVLALLPSLGSSRGLSPSPAPSVRIVNRQEVGSFEVTTLAADDAKSLTSWLTANGFSVSPKAQGVIDAYIADGWVFVASKLQRDAPGITTSRPHPLAFTFPTTRHVYPMRLTGAEADRPLDLELYVFGASEAATPGLKPVRSDKVLIDFTERRSSEIGSRSLRQPLESDVTIQHSELGPLVGESSWATKLTGTLPVAEMQKDLYLNWSPGVSRGASVYARDDVAKIAGACVLVVLAVWALVIKAIRPKSKRLRSLIALGHGLVAVAIVLVAFFAIPGVRVTTDAARYGPRYLADAWWEAGQSLEKDGRVLSNWYPESKDVPLEDQAEVDRVLSIFIERFEQERTRLGERGTKLWPQTGDWPGRYKVERTHDVVKLHYYDDWGREWQTSLRPVTVRK